MSDWKTIAIEAHRAKMEAETVRLVENAETTEALRKSALIHKLVQLGIPKQSADEIKFKVVRDKAKPTEDVDSWELFIGLTKQANLYDDAMQTDWFGPVKTLEDVGLYLTCDPRVLIPPGYHYQREPEDYGSETQPESVSESAAEYILGYARGADFTIPEDRLDPTFDRFFYVLASIAESLVEITKKL